MIPTSQAGVIASGKYSGPLLDLTDGTFLRTTEGSFISNPTGDALDWAGADVIRLQVYGAEALYLLEGARTNLAIRSEDWNGWAQAACTLTLNAGTAPDGAADAATINYTANANARLTATFALADGTVVTQSRWVRNSSGDGSTRLQIVQRDGVTEVSQNSSATGTWVREVNRGVSVGAGASNPQYWHRAGSVAAIRSIFAWGGQLEVARYESSYIRTGNAAVTRGADLLTWLSSEVPFLLRGRASQIRVAPEWSTANLVSGNIRTLYSFGGVNDQLQVRHDGVGLVLEAVESGIVRATMSLPAVVRNVPVDVWVDPLSGMVGWAGVFGAAGTPWTWPTGQFRLGGTLGGNNEWDGGLGIPGTL